MKTIEIDEELYRYIAAQTQHIGENASDILRRLLLGDDATVAKGRAADRVSEETTVPASAIDNVFAAIETSGVGLLKRRVDRFLGMLSQLAQAHPDGFQRVLALKGRNRLYFATSEDALLTSGSSTNPKRIPDTAYWVVTNTNTQKKATMLVEVAQKLGYAEADAQQLVAILAPELQHD